MAKKGLGKGLDAFFPDVKPADLSFSSPAGETVIELKLSQVEPDKNQPRRSFDEEKLSELADSIREHGVITPIIVNDLENGFYRIVAGERRWRASKLAGVKSIPAIVRHMDKDKLYEVSLIENLQRQDLNPIEEAKGYKRLTEEFSLTQEQISKRLGKSRSSVANSLRILNLPKKVIDLIESGDLSFGHAKVLLSLDSDDARTSFAERTINEQMSVRELEKAISYPSKETKKPKKVDLNTKLAFKSLEDKVTEQLGTKVKISGGKNKGKIEIEYYGIDDLERIVNILQK